ncbi:hypothetical protein N658DRAFT_18761 [Parathielavia hyrcaniae]|uniref:Uncharacterized protein n=1 Tax=Parathielavia hyrcaniae TaxID=113614 RepID=A0AAN6T742_9PEZI|nr:hypothetical protein N658DRAFT_18761 [Parathielavia hyrcaniae]
MQRAPLLVPVESFVLGRAGQPIFSNRQLVGCVMEWVVGVAELPIGAKKDSASCWYGSVRNPCITLASLSQAPAGDMTPFALQPQIAAVPRKVSFPFPAKARRQPILNFLAATEVQKSRKSRTQQWASILLLAQKSFRPSRLQERLIAVCRDHSRAADAGYIHQLRAMPSRLTRLLNRLHLPLLRPRPSLSFSIIFVAPCRTRPGAGTDAGVPLPQGSAGKVTDRPGQARGAENEANRGLALGSLGIEMVAPHECGGEIRPWSLPLSRITPAPAQTPAKCDARRWLVIVHRGQRYFVLVGQRAQLVWLGQVPCGDRFHVFINRFPARRRCVTPRVSLTGAVSSPVQPKSGSTGWHSCYGIRMTGLNWFHGISFFLNPPG